MRVKIAIQKPGERTHDVIADAMAESVTDLISKEPAKMINNIMGLRGDWEIDSIFVVIQAKEKADS